MIKCAEDSERGYRLRNENRHRHSLGSVVAYEATQELEHPLPLLITLGSPLGLNTIVYQRLRPQPPSFPPMATSIEHIKAGQLRPLAVTGAGAARCPAGWRLMPGYEASGWQGVGAARGTPTSRRQAQQGN